MVGSPADQCPQPIREAALTLAPAAHPALLLQVSAADVGLEDAALEDDSVVTIAPGARDAAVARTSPASLRLLSFGWLNMATLIKWVGGGRRGGEGSHGAWGP